MPLLQPLLLSTVMVAYAPQIHPKEPVVLHSMQLIVPVIIIKCVFVASGTNSVLTAVPLTLIAMVYVLIQREHVNDKNASAIKPLPLPWLKLNLTVSTQMVVVTYVASPDSAVLVPVARDAMILMSGTIHTATVAHHRVALKKLAHVHKLKTPTLKLFFVTII